MRWSIIIFCYNEEQTIQDVVQSAIQFLLKSEFEDSEIIIVDDGSNDKTPSICQHLSEKNARINLITHKKNLGIGAALKSGYLAVQKEYVCAIPGDGQFDIEELSLVEPFDSSQFVSFFRTSKNYNLYRSFLTWMNNKFNVLLLGIKLTDVNWIKIYPAEKLTGISFELNSSLIESEIVGKLMSQNCRPIEIESKYLPRKGGISRGGSRKTLLKAIKEIGLLYGSIKRYKKNMH